MRLIDYTLLQLVEEKLLKLNQCESYCGIIRINDNYYLEKEKKRVARKMSNNQIVFDRVR